MATAREIDSNGFLLVKACPISSFGIFDYGAGQLGLPGDPNRIVKVFRPESAVNDPEAIESFKNVPLIDDHEMLSGFEGDESATNPDDYGVSGVLTSNVYYAAPWMCGDLKIFSRDMQEKINSGKKDLSLGYSCKFEIKPGIFDGQAYEAIQTELRGNHIALVGQGRVPGARVLDGLCFDHLRFDVRPSDKEPIMSGKEGKKAAMDNAVAQLKALLPALEQYLNEEAQEPAHQGGGEMQPAAATAQPGEADASAQSAAPAEPGEPAEPAAEPAAPAEAGGDLPTLIQNVETILAQLKSMTSGAPSGAAGDENMQPIEEQPAKDGEEQGKASPGPAAGVHSAADAAVQKFYADMAEKSATYERLSSIIGAFDHAKMDAKAISIYGVKKLNIKCADGQEGIALDAYLNGVESAKKATKQVVQKRAADSATATAELDNYLKGVK